MMKTSDKILAVCICLLAIMTSCLPKEDTGGQGCRENRQNEVSTVFYPGENGVFIYRIPVIVMSKKGTLLAFAEARQESIEDVSNIDIVLKRSEDNGKSWGRMQVLKDNGSDVAGMPSPVVLENGKIILLYTLFPIDGKKDRHVYMISSEDDGKSWSEEVEITAQLLDKGQSGYATCPVHGLVKRYGPCKGRIIMPARVNVSVADGTWTTPRAAHIIYSDDEGRTWHQGGYMDHSWGSECTVTELCNGDLLLNTRDGNDSDFYRYQAYSHDGGISFEPTKKTDLVEPVSGCQGSIITYGVNPDNKEKSIVLFSNPSHTKNRKRGSVKLSHDSGATWSRMFLYTADGGNTVYAAYSDLVILDNGSIGIFYESGKSYSEGLKFFTMEVTDIQDKYTYTID